MRQTSFFRKYKLHHLLFWALLYGGWYYFRYQDFSTDTTAFRMILTKVIDLALLVYITNYLLIPQLLYKKKYVLFGIVYVLMVIGLSILKMYAEGRIMNRPDMFNFTDNLKVRIYDNIIPHFLLVSTGAAFKIMIDYARAQKRLGDMAKEKAETELNFLKSQINPHFLFNSLNAVYFLIHKTNPAAREALHKFSEMLRYQLYECNGNKIPVEKEISYLEDYVNLQKLRGDENCFVEFNYTQAVKGFMIEPLLLIPFVENSFKHLSHFSNGSPNKIKIDISRIKNEFHFSVVNTTETHSINNLNGSRGIGLPNVKRRLELLYPGKHTFFVQKIDNSFEVYLTLLID
jgi:two-component system, LytTR family, sensor kinase